LKEDKTEYWKNGKYGWMFYAKIITPFLGVKGCARRIRENNGKKIP
jgi:hypothetical protein